MQKKKREDYSYKKGSTSLQRHNIAFKILFDHILYLIEKHISNIEKFGNKYRNIFSFDILER